MTATADILVALALAALAGLLLGYALGWKTRGKHESERRGGDIYGSRW